VWTYNGVKVHWLGHDSFVIQGTRTVILDPFQVKGDYKADLLLISHEHSDHMSVDDVARFSTPSTRIVAGKQCEGGLRQLKQEKTFVAPGSKVDHLGVFVEAVPAYNVNKFRAPGQPFHPKQDGKVGYTVELDEVKFYHAGDTDKIPEMKQVNVDVALLPVSGTYVMTAEEAAEAVKEMRVKVAIPMHFGKIVGSRADAEKFKKLVGSYCRVEILEKE
jgi:L-ascorbate metabolism protein UlaG (beta-lactamase superfamily)